MMIRRTLAATQAATFSIELPSAAQRGMPTPTGTGFFVSPDGLFMTAGHVITQNGRSDGPVRTDLGAAWLSKELRVRVGGPPVGCQGLALIWHDPAVDIALLRVDFGANRQKDWLHGRSGFPFVNVSTRELEEGEPVYAFGYPLSQAHIAQVGPMTIGATALAPRVTSAIVSSTLEATQVVMSTRDPLVYVLDKALNYGNSGGPIIATATGHAHAVCTRFQPVFVGQPHLKDAQGQQLSVMTPSLYGLVSSLQTPLVRQALKSAGVPLADQ